MLNTYTIRTKKNFVYLFDFSSNTFYVKGPLGSLDLKFKNMVLKCSDTYFVKKNFLKTFFSFIKNSFVGLNYGYFSRLEVFGLGYKVINERSDLSTLCLDLGCTHWVFYKFPLCDNIFSITKDKIIYIYGTSLSLVNSHANEIRNIRKLTPYKPKGIKHFNELLKLKQTKQK